MCIGNWISGSIVECAVVMTNCIWTILEFGEDTTIDLCGNTCVGNLKAHLSSSFKLMWDAKFQCSRKGQGVVGRFTAVGRESAMKGAITDWVTKVLDVGAINADDFKC